MPAMGEGDLGLRKHLDFGSDGVDAAIVRGVELEDGVFELVAEGLSREGHDGGGFTAAGGTGEKNVRHVAVF